MSVDLDDLLRRAKLGEERALNELVNVLRPYLKTVAARKLPARLRVRKDASDLVQETLEEGFRNFDRFAGATHEELRGYLQRILERNAVDTVRRELDALCRSADAEESLDARQGDGSLKSQFVADQTSPSGRVARSELLDIVMTVMERLPKEQRAALSLWLQRYSFHEIAEELEKTESAAQSLVKHALKTLRERVPAALRDDPLWTSGEQDDK